MHNIAENRFLPKNMEIFRYHPFVEMQFSTISEWIENDSFRYR